MKHVNITESCGADEVDGKTFGKCYHLTEKRDDFRVVASECRVKFNPQAEVVRIESMEENQHLLSKQ